ncbi:MAG: RiPP maturation radical SAM protein 1 [Chloroflexi bacterium]|nr:RiPP maturation radical SAM protein 1 [Chloroflexota bacterium]
MTQPQKPIALVAMPFGACWMPALGISLLKSAVRQKGFECDMHYFNLSLAARMGAEQYGLFADQLPFSALVGEWLFASALFGENRDADQQYVERILLGDLADIMSPVSVLSLLFLRDDMVQFVQACFEAVDWSQYRIVGFSVSFQQNCASLALARLIKSGHPDVTIVFGGADYAEEMGAAWCRLFPFIDFVCTDEEGDRAFPALVEAIFNRDTAASIPGMLSRASVLPNEPGGPSLPVSDLDALPYPDFTDYFAQAKGVKTLPEAQMRLPVETSRGCWWGQVQHCTFCNANLSKRRFRSKSPSRVLNEFTHLREKYPGVSQFRVADSILDYRYFQSLLPELAARPLGLTFIWEVKANLKREQVALLARAGVRTIQPGIESLSDPILRLMRKGTSRMQNVQTLKWAKEFGVQVLWHFLYGFPGEAPGEYAAMQDLVPLLLHLDAPLTYAHIRFDRFGAYYQAPEAYGITQLTPARAYQFVYHPLGEENLRQIAYFFDAEYPDYSANYTRGVVQAVKEWQGRGDVALDVFLSLPSIHIVDTRTRGETRAYHFDGLAAELYLLCDAAQTVRALMDTPSIRERATEAEVVALLNQFVEQGLMIREGKRYLSLAVVRDGHSSAH